MTTRDRVSLAACLTGLAVLALYTGAALRSTTALAFAACLTGAAVALLFRTPEDQ